MIKLIWYCPRCGNTFDRHESDPVMACGTCPTLAIEAILGIPDQPLPDPDPLEALLVDVDQR